MKNAFLTKTLLCGVMATTFFLINCQKAPSRGVKAKTADGAAADAAAKVAAQNAVECSQDFLTKYKELNNSLNELKKDVAAESIDEAKKQELSEKIKTLQTKTNEVVAEIKKVKSGATACVVVDKDKRVQATYPIANIEGLFNDIVVKLNEKEIKVEGVTEVVIAKKEKAASEKDAKSLSTGQVFNLSKELAEVLTQANINVVYFKAGQIVKNGSAESLAKDKANNKLTLCEIGSGTENEEKAEKVTVTDVSAVSKDVKTERLMFSVAMVANSATIKLNCLLADGKRASLGQEFRNVFAENLLTQKNIEAQKKKADEKAKTAVAKAKHEVEAKEQGVQSTTKGIENAEAAVAEKEKEIAAAATAKEDALVKKLTDAKEELVKKVETLKKDLETVKKQKTDAEAALKKAQDAEAAKAS